MGCPPHQVPRPKRQRSAGPVVLGGLVMVPGPPTLGNVPWDGIPVGNFPTARGYGMSGLSGPDHVHLIVHRDGGGGGELGGPRNQYDAGGGDRVVNLARHAVAGDA